MGIADFYEDSVTNHDDLAQIREALAAARENRVKSDIMADLVALRDEVLGSDKEAKVTISTRKADKRIKGAKSAENAEYPHSMTDAEGRTVRYKVVGNGTKVLKPNRVHAFSYKRDNYMDNVDIPGIPVGMGEWVSNPEWLICALEDIEDSSDILAEYLA